ncbi:MAG: hypothetical protein HRT44_00690 [Bdellovibrionales bacterium]|nr:hypothetical protein [Bdellovibrionales bacterium]
MNKIYGLPILVGFFLSAILPDYSIQMNSWSIYILLAMSFVTSTQFSLKPILQIRKYSFSYIFSFLFSYVLLLLIADMLCHIVHIKSSYRITLLLVICSPFALIAPLFTRKDQGDLYLSQSLIVLSTLMCPALVYFMLKFFDPQAIIPLSTVPVSRILTLLAVIMLFTMLVSPFVNIFKTPYWYTFQSYFSSISIAALVYIFWGQTWPLINSTQVSNKTLVFMGAFLLCLDFLVYFLLRFLNTYSDPEQAKATRITLSMRNMAVPTALVATFIPNSLFIPALGFASHILFFNFLAIRKKI